MSELPQLELPASLKTDVVVLKRKRMRTPWRPAEFLPYHVTALKELTWDEMWELFDVKVEDTRAPRTFSFTLSDDQAEIWKVACRWKSSSESWSDTIGRDSIGAQRGMPKLPKGVTAMPVGTRESRSLQCRLSPVAGDQRWTLEFDQSGAIPSLTSETEQRMESNPPELQLVGRLTNGNVTYEVNASHAVKSGRMLGISFSSGSWKKIFAKSNVHLVGYFLSLDQEPVAAVTTEPAGRLILRNSVAPEDRPLMAAVACAILVLP